jgi:hypothetical protein
VCPIGLQPSTRLVVEEWVGGIVDVSHLLVTHFHAVLSWVGAVLFGRELSRVFTTRHAKKTRSFSDRIISPHCMNSEIWRRYYDTVGLPVSRFRPDVIELRCEGGTKALHTVILRTSYLD